MLKPIGIDKTPCETDIAVLLNVHANPKMARDTLDSIRKWVSRKILMIVDKKGWHHFENFRHPDTEVLCGVYHGVGRSPYKNIAIGLQRLYEMWPDATWYVYLESDVVVLSSAFKADLVSLESKDVTLAAVEHRVQPKANNHWLVREILGKQDNPLICHKTLGAVMFFSHKCIKPLIAKNFFKEVLLRTKEFRGAKFPNFTDYAVEEIIYPSAAAAYGTVVGLKALNGNPTAYRVRFVPNVRLDEVTIATTIAHPTKRYDDPVREHARCLRNAESLPMTTESKNVRLE